MTKSTHTPLRSEVRAAEKAKNRAARGAKAPTPKQLQREALRRAERRRRFLTYSVPVLLGVALLGLALLVGGGGGEPAPSDQVRVEGPARNAPLQPGERIPNYTAPGLSGGTIEWKEHAGEAPILLVVWASWCPHCQEELPVLGEIAKEYPEVHVMTLVTFVGQRPGPAPLDFLQDNGLSFETAVDDGDATIAMALGIQGTPAFFSVAPDGTIVRTSPGRLGEAGLREVLEELSSLAE